MHMKIKSHLKVHSKLKHKTSNELNSKSSE